MKRLLAVAVAIAAVAMLSESNANAQTYAGGYQFGTGIAASQGFGRGCCSQPREQLPYFAKFPPVYYSNIVARPVGISPFAAPPGIQPVEMNYAPAKSVTISNPYFDRKATPAKGLRTLKPRVNNKMTSIANPYIGSVATN